MKDETKEQFVPIAANQPEILNSKQLTDFFKKLKEAKSTKEINDSKEEFKKYINAFEEESNKYEAGKKEIDTWIEQNLKDNKHSEIKNNLLSEIERIHKVILVPDFDKDKFAKALKELKEKKQEAESMKKELEDRRQKALEEIGKIPSSYENGILFEIEDKEGFTKQINDAKNTSEIEKIIEIARNKAKSYGSK
ncbi:hypothetical protein JM47_00755 [Ureaplasma diversum]|uniref:Uncharacterized protein n=1 Tax=Ureaplasma diversum TaxID=42094 RepID=A0A0C5RL66_9BACT|nr:hypothetical protein [Ureaplasma diversum]AJQ45177.1 hypothetical protein JM47_00755 [Ureaplasma diversum]